MADSQFQQLKQQERLSDDRKKINQLNRVGKRIVEAARSRPDGRDLPPYEEWEFVVFDNDQVNAFAMPGGKVGFYTGIWKVFENDDDVAVVMAHEVAHIVAEHGNERVTQQLLVTGAGLGLAVGMDQGELDATTQQIVLAAFGVSSTLGVLSYSREHEEEADQIGLVYMAEAGYDPRRAIVLWQKMSAMGGANVPEFLSTHPSDETRVQNMRELMPSVMPLYEQRLREINGR